MEDEVKNSMISAPVISSTYEENTLQTSSPSIQSPLSKSDKSNKLIEQDVMDTMTMLASPKAMMAFEIFLENNDSKALMGFWNDAENYKTLEDPLMLIDTGLNIFNTYFSSPDSMLSTSLDESIVQQLKGKANHRIFDKNTFNVAQSFVFDMIDKVYFPSFRRTINEFIEMEDHFELKVQKEKEDQEILKQQEELEILKQQEELKQILEASSIHDSAEEDYGK